MTENGPYVIYAHKPLDPNGHSHLDAAHEKHQFPEACSVSAIFGG